MRRDQKIYLSIVVGAFSPQTCLEAADKESLSTSAIGNFASSYLEHCRLALSKPPESRQVPRRRFSPTAVSSRRWRNWRALCSHFRNRTHEIQAGDRASCDESAKRRAQSQGNSGAAGQLTQLASDFTTASQTGQLPNLQDLAQAVGGSGGGHHHHHHAQSASNQLLSSLQQTSDSQSTQNTSIDPGTIILQTLANAGISTSNS